MKKQLLSTLLALCMVLALLPVTALAAETSGSCGDNVTWSYSDGTLTIQGTGSMKDYNGITANGPTDTPWNDYMYEIQTVTIGDGVTNIGDFAFFCAEKLTSVTIPASVTSIGTATFNGCYRLTSVDIPASVTSIGEMAFSGCFGLTGITIPNGVTTIKDSAFFQCNSLTSVIIPASVTSIENSAFQNCQGLTSVTISDSVTSIGARAFNGCYNLTSLTIPASVTSIGELAFANCKGLTDVYYGGDESQWGQITIGEDNDPLLNAGIQYNSPMPSAPSTPAEPEQPTTPSAPSTPAEPEQPTTPSGISVTVDSIAVTWTDAEPFIDANSRTMVPLRAVADAMGLDVNWDGSAREAVFTNGSKTIYFPIDSNTARTSDGGAVQMDTAAVIVNDRTYAPIRYLAEYFGYEVGWDAATRTVTIK